MVRSGLLRLWVYGCYRLQSVERRGLPDWNDSGLQGF